MTSNSSLGELARLEQHGVRNAHLADVVQDRGLVDVVDEALVDRLPVGRAAWPSPRPAAGRTPGSAPDGCRCPRRGTRPAWPAPGSWPRGRAGACGWTPADPSRGCLRLGAVPQHAPEPDRAPRPGSAQRRGGALDEEHASPRRAQLALERLHGPARARGTPRTCRPGPAVALRRSGSCRMFRLAQFGLGSAQDAAGGVVHEGEAGRPSRPRNSPPRCSPGWCGTSPRSP